MKPLPFNLNIQNLWVGTFHGICYRILRQHFLAAKLDKNFQIIDSEDQIRLIKRILKLNSIDENFISPKQYVNYINRKKDSSIRSRDIVDKDFSEKRRCSWICVHLLDCITVKFNFLCPSEFWIKKVFPWVNFKFSHNTKFSARFEK